MLNRQTQAVMRSNRLSRILVGKGSHTLSWRRANYKRRQERAGARADPIVSELQTSEVVGHQDLQPSPVAASPDADLRCCCLVVRVKDADGVF